MIGSSRSYFKSSFFIFINQLLLLLFLMESWRLAISFSRELSMEINVEQNIKKARRTTYSLMASGLHGHNGLDPETALQLFKTYVLPISLYGMEILLLLNIYCSPVHFSSTTVFASIFSFEINPFLRYVFLYSRSSIGLWK
jgi:hypothetical protein